MLVRTCHVWISSVIAEEAQYNVEYVQVFHVFDPGRLAWPDCKESVSAEQIQFGEYSIAQPRCFDQKAI